MNPTRNGKIARLPFEVRELLNRHLQNGQSGKHLVTWLNSRPDVRAVLAAEFSGRPIREQNLSEWKQGGYRDWLALQEAREVSARLEEEMAVCGDAESPPLSETLARWLAARYAVATRRLLETEGPEHWRLLRELCKDVVELRRGDHSAERLELERSRAFALNMASEMRCNNQIEIGIKALSAYVKQFPEMLEDYRSLLMHMRRQSGFSLPPEDAERAGVGETP